jgi:hypothetical protein
MKHRVRKNSLLRISPPRAVVCGKKVLMNFLKTDVTSIQVLEDQELIRMRMLILLLHLIFFSINPGAAASVLAAASAGLFPSPGQNISLLSLVTESFRVSDSPIQRDDNNEGP